MTILLKSLLVSLAVGFSLPVQAKDGERRLFLPSAVEDNSNNTVSLPLLKGSSRGRTVWYVVLDASTSEAADRYGANRANKLRNARGTIAVQKVKLVGGIIDFPASVDFGPERLVTPGPQGFPPAQAQPGAVGEFGYSPLIELPDGTVLNAPHLANDSGQANKVVRLDTANGRVIYAETPGFANDKEVYYISTDASDMVAAALEDVTFASALNAAPFVGGDGSNSSRATLIAFVNGQIGANNPGRQGLNAALLDGLSPLNVLRWTPNQGRYSPLWDVSAAAWSADAISNGNNTRQTKAQRIEDLAKGGQITAPGGGPFGAAGFIVNCPVVSEEE